jgi:potassium efflux system protein
MPPALAVTAAAGYYYTAQQLAQRVTFTVEILVAVLIIRALLLRWTIVSQRRLAIDQARERRTAAQNEKMLDEDSPVNATRAAVKPERDLATIIIQARRLMGYSLGLAVLLGLWCTWANVLPALGVLNRIEMWKRDNSAPSANGVAADIIATPLKTEAAGTGGDAAAGSENTRPSQASAGRRNECVTLGDLLLAAVVLATTFIAAKNIPGLLEMAVLQHLPIDASARYALSMVSRYLMSIIGITLACSLMGLGWAKVQWLVTAVCVGLGFGLQEIFANFISGLIILFERPVRVRDVVTIADVTGVVSRIRLRTTTITDWDRKELIIPNKEFITGRVLNWTLSDPVNRVVINIGVAYGSDTERTAEILQRVAQEHPNVLKDPPPRVTLESFGDSALKFVLRFFLPNLDNRVTAIHDIHMGIERALREAGIEMPFPQYDVHIRSADANVPLMFTQASAAARTPLFAPPRSDAPLPRRAA